MHLADLLKLSGIVIVVIGLALRLRTTLVVVTAGLVTGVAAGLPLFSEGPGQVGIINMLGKAFSDNRLMTLFIITLPAIGLAERHGLQEQSAVVIRKLAAATVGRLQIVYQLFRVLTGMLGVRLNGHPSFVRPLIFPMSVGAAEATFGASSAEGVPEDALEEIKASNAASENYGNFYGQNLSLVQPGILLVFGVMTGLGYSITVWNLVMFAIPIATISVVLGATQFWLFDRRLRRKAATTR